MRATAADNAAVARELVKSIRLERARQMNTTPESGRPVMPDGAKRVFILDSLRHPHEVALLRQIYQDAFCLIGVVCEETERRRRLSEDKYREAGIAAIRKFMKRDENARESNGQKVSETFHLADFFIDNSMPRFLKEDGAGEGNPDWDVSEQLGRLVDILTHTSIVRPRPNETGMFHAHGARMRSSCLSRQVGAALLDNLGDVVATGTNEVPKPGGGVYGGSFSERSDSDPNPVNDFRCFLHKQYCSNSRTQIDIVRDLLAGIEEFRIIEASDDLVNRILGETKIGQLIEFSRAVHAEMDALLSAGRQGVSTLGTRLFVTTFPCHNCARHIVSAGIDEVQFIEPYLKSEAIPLHGDAITLSPTGWRPPSWSGSINEEVNGGKKKVLFRPFVGVAPRLYRRAFLKDRELKDKFTGDMKTSFESYDGSHKWSMLGVSYAEVEARLAGTVEEGGL